MPEQDTLLEVSGLKMHFPIRRGVFRRVVGHVKAVDGVSFKVQRGATLGLVGESGCGKTTVGRAILRLYDPTAGRVMFDGQAVHSMQGEPLRELRQRMQIIFQDPYGSLNPRMTVANIVGEPLAVHDVGTKAGRHKRVCELLERVGLSERHINHYPHEFSGGQRQRIGIARALALQPDFIVCDEAVSALDVSIQAQIINLLEDLQEEMGLSYLFIAHDLAVVEHISSHVAVMYLGRIVETASRDQLYATPRHPYTQALLAAIPRTDPDAPKGQAVLGGDVPSPVRPPRGCHFHPRCPLASEECSASTPELRELDSGHFVRCFKA